MQENNADIKSIINVNYAGEYGAIRLYKAQTSIAKYRHKKLLPMLHMILQDEQLHCKIFREIMPKYQMVPCRLTWIWGIAGYVLGVVTALLGKRAMLICIKAAENTAHTHLSAQSEYLKGKDDVLANVINEINQAEHTHVTLSESGLSEGPEHFYDSFLYTTIYTICQATMWLVTQGDSGKLKKTYK